MDHLQAIRAFARVVETDGFNRAAESLQMPNATLTKSIQLLENRLRVELLERSTRRVGVTSDGARTTDAQSIFLLNWTISRPPSGVRKPIRVDGYEWIAAAQRPVTY